MIYLTYNDQPSGVFSSQVNDVVNYINKEFNAHVKLVAIISIRGFSKNRDSIRKEVPGALVLPALPTAQYWKVSAFIFMVYCLLTGEKKIISRNIIATLIALKARNAGVVKKVCLDGRGAIAAEWKEYDVVSYPEMKNNIAGWEKKAVLESDFRIAVSEQLAQWWKSEYGYNGNGNVVIPCTLHTSFKLSVPPQNEVKATRTKENFDMADIIMVYSGSTSGWQSFSSLETILGKILGAGKQFKLLFLSKSDSSIDKMKEKYPGQVFNRWLTFDQVQPVLNMCDYGILYREQSITNKVAAPTKFAEYLSAGLPVLISEGIGDYSSFVEKYQCGYIIDKKSNLHPEKVSAEKKETMIELVSSYYTKDANKNNYKKLLDAMS